MRDNEPLGPEPAEGRYQTIHLKNSYFEGLIMVGPNRQPIFSRPFNALLEKKVFPGEFRPGYWLGRVFDKIIQEINVYLKEKQKLIRDHTKKHEKDWQKTDEKGAAIKNLPAGRVAGWKKDDPIFLDNGSPDWIDFDAYLKEFNVLQEIEVDLGIRPIAFDPEKGPDVNGQEMLLLIPLLKEPVEDSKVSPFKKK